MTPQIPKSKTAVLVNQPFRTWRPQQILNRATLYGCMALLIVIGYALLVSGLSLVFAGSVQANPIISGLIFFILALAVLPLRQRLQHTLDSIFFHGPGAYQEKLETFSAGLADLADLPSILQLLRGSIEQSLMPAVLHIYIYDSLVDQYSASPDEHKRPTSDLKFSPASSLVALLSRQAGPIQSSEARQLPQDQARINLLGAQLFAPLPGRARLAGWLALGPGLSGDAYTSRELEFLNGLCRPGSPGD